jgi:hypothetical protein
MNGSWVGGLDESDDVELGYLKWPPRAEKVGVSGDEVSDTE